MKQGIDAGMPVTIGVLDHPLTTDESRSNSEHPDAPRRTQNMARSRVDYQDDDEGYLNHRH